MRAGWEKVGLTASPNCICCAKSLQISGHYLASPPVLPAIHSVRPSPPPRDVAHGNGDCFLLADQHDQLLSSSHASVEQVPLQHCVVLGQNRDYDGRVFGALALVDRPGVGG